MCNVWKGEWKKGPALRHTVSLPTVLTKEIGKDGVESVAQMCNFISGLFCVQRGDGGREGL